MLSEAQRMRERIIYALSRINLSDAEIGRLCGGATRQAVSGWRATGRVKKENLRKLAELAGLDLAKLTDVDYPLENFDRPNSDLATPERPTELTREQASRARDVLVAHIRAMDDAHVRALLSLLRLEVPADAPSSRRLPKPIDAGANTRHELHGKPSSGRTRRSDKQ